MLDCITFRLMCENNLCYETCPMPGNPSTGGPFFFSTCGPGRFICRLYPPSSRIRLSIIPCYGDPYAAGLLLPTLLLLFLLFVLLLPPLLLFLLFLPLQAPPLLCCRIAIPVRRSGPLLYSSNRKNNPCALLSNLLLSCVRSV